jgi:hypothetical protein
MCNTQRQHLTILSAILWWKFSTKQQEFSQKYLASYVDETALNWNEFLPD